MCSLCGCFPIDRSITSSSIYSCCISIVSSSLEQSLCSLARRAMLRCILPRRAKGCFLYLLFCCCALCVALQASSFVVLIIFSQIDSIIYNRRISWYKLKLSVSMMIVDKQRMSQGQILLHTTNEIDRWRLLASKDRLLRIMFLQVRAKEIDAYIWLIGRKRDACMAAGGSILFYSFRLRSASNSNPGDICWVNHTGLWHGCLYSIGFNPYWFLVFLQYFYLNKL